MLNEYDKSWTLEMEPRLVPKMEARIDSSTGSRHSGSLKHFLGFVYSLYMVPSQYEVSSNGMLC